MSQKPQPSKSIPLLNTKTKRARIARSKQDQSSPSTMSKANQSDIENKISELTIELRQKQRMVAQINNQTSNIEESVKQELFTRDTHIDRLNERILELEQLVKGKEKKVNKRNAERDKIYKDVNELLVDNHNLQNRCLHYETQLQSEKDLKAKTVDENELLGEALNEEIEDLKKQLELKNQQNEDTKQDVMHMSKIVQDMTGLNNELNDKVANLNVELERLNHENFEVKKKSEHMDEIEKQLLDSNQESNDLIKQTKKQNSLIEYLKSEKEASETCYNKNADHVTQIETKLMEMSRLVENENSPNLGLVVTALAEMSKALEDVKSSLQSVICRPIPVNVNDNQVNMKDEINALKQTVNEREKSIRKFETESRLLNERFADLTEQTNNAKSEAEDIQRQGKVRIDRLEAEVERLKTKSHKIRLKANKVQIALNKSDTKNATLKSRLDETKRNLDENSKRTTQLELGNKDMRQQLLKFQTESTTREREFQAKDQRVRKAVSLIKAYEQEVFTRDSEILKKETANGQLKNQIEELKRLNTVLKGKMKTIVADEIEQANRLLADRDNEIKILKEMVRSTQNQMKTIEKDAFSIKKRMDGPVSETRFKKRPLAKPANQTLKIVANFITEIKEIDRWIKEKSARFTTETWSAAQMKIILGVEVKGTGELNVEKTLAETRQEMVATLFNTTSLSLAKHNDKISPKQLKKKTNYEKLTTLVAQRGSEMLTTEELTTLLGKL